jgi:hypothetical protein
MYPSSLYEFGPNQIAASALYLTLKICGFPFTWCKFLEEVTMYKKQDLKEASRKIVKKYIDLTFNGSEEKEVRLSLIQFKYSSI